MSPHRVLRMQNIVWAWGSLRPLECPTQILFVRSSIPWLALRGKLGIGVAYECYLVDPASSHMLVSKIKPCMCKYELIQTVKLRMAH